MLGTVCGIECGTECGTECGSKCGIIAAGARHRQTKGSRPSSVSSIVVSYKGVLNAGIFNIFALFLVVGVSMPKLDAHLTYKRVVSYNPVPQMTSGDSHSLD